MGGDSSAALAHLGALAPQLRRISDFYHRNHLRMLMDPMSTRMSLQAGMGLLQLDLLGSVKACNDIGADILAKGYPLRQGPKGRISFCSDRLAEAFKRLTRDIIQRSGPVSAQTGFEGGYEFCFVANGLDDAATAFIGSTITLLVTMDKTKHLALQNQLSPAETRILHALIEGHKPKQIAEINNVSVQTIRSQLKSIFSKTGVKSQSELVVICAQGGLGLGPQTTQAGQSLS